MFWWFLCGFDGLMNGFVFSLVACIDGFVGHVSVLEVSFGFTVGLMVLCSVGFGLNGFTVVPL